MFKLIHDTESAQISQNDGHIYIYIYIYIKCLNKWIHTYRLAYDRDRYMHDKWYTLTKSTY